jgi:PKHD-type hydroxylase
MQHIMTPYTRKIEPYVWCDDGFTSQELDILQDIAKNACTNASVSSNIVDKQIRRSNVYWMDKNIETAWVFNKLSYIVSTLNAKFYGFNLTGFGEAIQFTNYDGADDGMYKWHQDFNAEVSRKLSLVIQLSHPCDYEGGDLQLMSHEVMNIEKQRGLALVFPSWMVHQVTPVTRGTRQSLVAWISGPDFI